ncbi:MAG: response regulator YycF [Clostridia bacterium]|jgi:two-component system response regulator VicR|nr:response regulator YycF [Clostridia bacterium]MCI1999312.1 response regulator YycF [Clostridia bacterium]MCI2014735.1 response regulator YycF [Clostridia bacterium]
MNEKILVVDDEKNIVDIIKYNLKKEGYNVLTALDGEEAIEINEKEKPDLILLDIMMPKLDGYAVCRKIREKYNTPIIMLTARAEEVDKVLGLELGADDYVTKPFGTRELMARVKANLRRSTQLDNVKENKNKNLLVFRNLSIDIKLFEVKKDGKPIDLTLREFELLKFLASQKNQVFSRETLLEKVWGYEYFGDVRTVDVTVRRLREKIEYDPGKPTFIVTKRGVGYYFCG